MDKGKHCPWCKEEIGLWAVIKAAWPTMIKCPTCGSKLTYEIGLGRFFLTQVLPAVLIMAFLSYAFAYLILKKTAVKPLWIGLLLFVILWSLFEFGIAVYWRKNKKLKIQI
ncbi:MAG: hypothetical protein EHM45_10385 [Desulfobacteraceae bacterium]|nr:MAG: hypothetical protein EHM45_10385 [Desulfobacteraceae bacterium]